MTNITDQNAADAADETSDRQPIKGSVSFSDLKEADLLPDSPPLQTSPTTLAATAGLDATATATFGDICHKALDRGAGNATTPVDWERVCDQVIARADPPEAIVERARAVVASVGARVSEMGTILVTEKEFGFRCNDWYVTGQIDALVDQGAGQVAVLDFKTGALANAHPFQLSLYRLACTEDASIQAELSGQVTDAIFVFVDAEAEPSLVPVANENHRKDETHIQEELRTALDAFEDPACLFEHFSTEWD